MGPYAHATPPPYDTRRDKTRPPVAIVVDAPDMIRAEAVVAFAKAAGAAENAVYVSALGCVGGDIELAGKGGVEACRPRLAAALAKIAPHAIIAIGTIARMACAAPMRHGCKKNVIGKVPKTNVALDSITSGPERLARSVSSAGRVLDRITLLPPRVEVCRHEHRAVGVWINDGARTPLLQCHCGHIKG